MFASAALLLLVILLLLLLWPGRRPKNFPPGPQPMPIIGNILELSLENPVADFERLAKRYGNVYSLFFGPRPAVIINGLQAFKEAYINKAADFAGRPQDILLSDSMVAKDHAQGLVMVDYNPAWREQRRFGLMTLKNFGLGKQSMEDRILGEIHHITKILEKNVGKAMDPHRMFHSATANIICQVLFSRRFDYDDELMKFFVGAFFNASKIANGRWGMIYDFIPLVRSLPLPFRRAFDLFRSTMDKHQAVMNEIRKTRVPGEPRNFVDCYLDELDKRGNDGSSFNEDQLCSVILHLHFAGSDTTANTILFGLLYLMNHPHVQERCQQEIDKVLGGKEEATFEDRHEMPYVQAVIHEIQRVANIAPLGVYRSTTKDTEVMGHSIPKGTIVIANMTSVLFEEGQWKSPHEFHPENFLNDKGEFFKPEAFIPFSAGLRMCLGEGMARMELFLMMVTLMRKFKFIWPEDAGEPDYVPLFGTTQTPKSFRMKIELRRTA